MKEFLATNYGVPGMRFTIDRPGLFTTSRLQRDNSWRGYDETERGHLMENDLVLDNLAFTADYIPPDQRHKYVYFSGGFERKLEDMIPIIHRNQKPRIPKFREFVRVFSEGDKRKDNLLVIDLDGNLRFVDPIESTILSPTAFTLGFYASGSHPYIGRGARYEVSKSFIYNLYIRSLRCWIVHLNTQIPNISLSEDYFERTSEKDLLKKIRTLTYAINVNK